VQMDDVFLL